MFIFLYPYEVGDGVCVEVVGTSPLSPSKGTYPRPFVFCYTAYSRMAYSASFICQTQSVGSTLIHSSVLYCFALLICITQRKVSSFFLLVILRFAQSVKAKRKDARCAVLFLLLYSAKLCLVSRPRMKVEMRRFNFLYCFSSLTQLHSASPPFASFVTFSYIKI